MKVVAVACGFVLLLVTVAFVALVVALLSVSVDTLLLLCLLEAVPHT